MKQLEWDGIWDHFNEWHTKEEEKDKCKTCHTHQGLRGDWPDQQKKIKQLVEKEIRRVYGKKRSNR